MDLNEAREFIKVSKEEEKAVNAYYMKYSQVRINMLASFDPYVFRDAKPEDKSINAEQLKQDIDEFIKIYSAMYKQKREISSRQLIRGTGNNEAKTIHDGGTYSRMIFASAKENIARIFCEAGNAALIRIKVEGEIPVADLSLDESELVLAPFAKVNKAQHTSNYNGVNYYDIIISAPELEEIPQERIDELKQEIFEEFPEFVDGANNLKDDGTRAILDEEHMKLYRFKSKLTELMQGLCRQKEIEIDKAKGIVKEQGNKTIVNESEQKIEEASIQTEETKIENAQETEIYNEEEKDKYSMQEESSKQAIESVQEELDKLEIAKLQSLATIGIQEGTKLEQFIAKEYKELVSKEESYVGAAQKLGIYFEKRIQNENIESEVSRISRNIRRSKG